jgi:rhamnulokinase
MLESAAPFRSLVDPDDPCFVRPDDMPKAIDAFCVETGQPVPSGPGAYARAVLESLALKYRMVLEQLERLTGTRFDTIRVIGGGVQNSALNQFTADATGRNVLAGPAEAAALGNLAMQMLAIGAVRSLDDARDLFEHAFPPRPLEPSASANWDSAYSKFQTYCARVPSRVPGVFHLS